MELFMVVVGGKPEGRFTEQHDVFFGIADELKELVPSMYEFWPALEGRMHIDSWRKVGKVDGYNIQIIEKSEQNPNNSKRLYFVNLGGYKPNDMEEYHYKQLVVAADVAEAANSAKDPVFGEHRESSHLDDRYGIDVDGIYEVVDLLNPTVKEKYHIPIQAAANIPEDPLEVGYLKISKLV